MTKFYRATVDSFAGHFLPAGSVVSENHFKRLGLDGRGRPIKRTAAFGQDPKKVKDEPVKIEPGSTWVEVSAAEAKSAGWVDPDADDEAGPSAEDVTREADIKAASAAAN